MSKSQDIELLKKRMEIIEKRLDSLQNAPVCPKCGGEARPSTLYPTMFCQQEFGHCGFLVLEPVTNRRRGSQGHWPKAHFTRTHWRTDTGKVMGMEGYIYDPFLVLHFVAGQPVTKETYFSQ